MYVFFLLVWIILNGRITAEILVSGAVFSAFVYLFFRKFLGYHSGTDMKIARNLPGGALYVLLLIWEVVKANVHIIKLVLSPHISISPVLVSFKTDLKSDMARVIFANSITLTPGTITCDLSDDGTFWVHCLDHEMADGIADTRLVRLLRKTEEAKV